MRRVILFPMLGLAALAALPLAAQEAAPPAAPATDAGPSIPPAPTQVAAGRFHLDPAHASLLFRVSHLGFSNYTAQFTGFTADLAFDPANPEAMTLTAHVDPKRVETNFKSSDFDMNAIISGPEFLNAEQFPDISFVSTRVRMVAPDRAAVTGDLSLHGVTKPITLRVTFNGGYPPQPFDPGGARIGFSAVGTLYRSDFGIDFGIPAPGTTLGVSDAVEIVIEAEFQNPDASGAQTGP
ncbi:YceI family protein [Frigidibacter sp. MR17.14]|uniref:YceI family protein n=1 Tax=Frigidibacter sp. MR17.14 TaxID=3126509 RepID=UPI003012D3A3